MTKSQLKALITIAAVFTLGVLFLTGGFTTHGSFSKELPMEQAILSNWFDAFNRRDWSAIEGVYAEDALIHAKAGPLRGGHSIVEISEKWLSAIPDAHITPLHVSKEGDVIIAHWRIEGTLSGAIRDITPTGEKTAFHGLTCFRCRDSKVVEHWASVDYRALQSTAISSAV